MEEEETSVSIFQYFFPIFRLPIVDPSNGNVLYILNQKPLLRFLHHYVPNLDNYEHLSISIVDAGVGTFDNIEVRLKKDLVQ